MKKDIRGYEGIYVATEDGKVLALPKLQKMPRGGFREWNGRELATSNVGGYLHVVLHKDGKRKTVLIHRLICEAFHGPAPSEQHQVNHIDRCKTNNTPSNLEWVTAKGNTDHAIKTGRGKKATPIQSIDPVSGKVLKSYGRILDVALDGFSPSNVCSALRGSLKTSGGLKWQYKEKKT